MCREIGRQCSHTAYQGLSKGWSYNTISWHLNIFRAKKKKKCWENKHSLESMCKKSYGHLHWFRALSFFFSLLHSFPSVSRNLSAALSVMVAGFLEIHRKHFPPGKQPLSGKVLTVSSMPCFHLGLQYALLGVAATLVNPACEYNFITSC